MSYYNNDKTWDDLTRDGHYHAKQMVDALNNGLDKYYEWQSFRAGRDNATIATALGRTETEVAELDAMYAALKAMYDYANNQIPSQSDYFYSLRKFS